MKQLRKRTQWLGGITVLAVVASIVFALSAVQLKSLAVGSPEVQFADNVHGLSIVPASCPSYPHYGGDCSSSFSNNCTLSAAPTTISQGGSATLSWSVNPYLSPFVQQQGASITPGFPSVSVPSGATVVSPVQTTSYVLSGTYMTARGFFKVPIGNFSCGVTLAVCPTGQTVQNGVCSGATPPQLLRGPTSVITDTSQGASGRGPSMCTEQYYCGNDGNIWRTSAQCVPSLFQTCPDGCVTNNGVPSCVVIPSASVGTFTVTPSLVRAGDTVKVSWQVNNAASCTISGSNGDSWSCSGGQCATLTSQTSTSIQSQTTYTLHCLQLRRARGTWNDQRATVNIAPRFNEK